MSADLGKPGWGERLVARTAAIEDGAILKTAFYAMLAATVWLVVTDYLDRRQAEPFVPPQTQVDPANPVLPSVERPEIDPDDPAYRPTEQVRTAPETLAAPLEVALIGGGILQLTGTISMGAANQVAREVAARGEYIETVALDSPGGSVEDALAIGALIRENGYDTVVGDGRLCASSCPLVLASGDTRLVSESAAVGVHQIYAGFEPDRQIAAAQAMSDAQATTARITRHLTDMGVDPALWLHALDTPPDRLYYFSPQELEAYRLKTPQAPSSQSPSSQGGPDGEGDA